MPASMKLPLIPVKPRVRVVDASTEKLQLLAAGLPRGLLLWRDELAGWIGGFNRYGGGGADRAFAVEMYGGRPYTQDRVKHAAPVEIPYLSIGVLGGIQPDRLARTFRGVDDGFLSRFLFVWADALPDFALARGAFDDSEARDAFAWLATLDMEQDDTGRHPRPVPLTREAEDLLEDFARAARRRGAHASGLFAGTLAKARGHVLRLSAILEFLWWTAKPMSPEPQAITAEAVAAAVALVAEYFLPMAERVYGDAALPREERRARILAQHLRTKKLALFNARDLRLAVGGELRASADMDAACATLVEAGLIRPVTAPAKAGRKPKVFEVNPAVHGDAP
jgi:hypothetical protein